MSFVLSVEPESTAITSYSKPALLLNMPFKTESSLLPAFFVGIMIET